MAHDHSRLDRRSLLTGIVAMVGGVAIAPMARAMQAGMDPGFKPATPYMTAGQRALTAAVSERIIPTTDTPGAIAAEVPAFIEMMLSEWYWQAERDMVMSGLTAMDAFSHKTHGKPFAAITPEQQDAILTLAMQQTLTDAPKDSFEHLRQLVIFGYYSSEIGCTVERIYLPVPGKYDGAYPYAEVNRVFSS
ncbi:gluconate 2-dehydrogenase subunit 3 family protein [Asticcacaulis sp.]|uniref:gluconate 2-dehydrogenase subunit 3 family protein n=1 Tax=Asticcacaulis sp. TaxID=1872648 RepID=UPI002D15BBE0|nr:gluconate 2-dehydrogenase subunit 3 family protein [Asticcacaulis sp.]HTM79643.1 gluconate 2-dehydrogenase subunit 3 family protein [Asticcacaulis sp.]